MVFKDQVVIIVDICFSEFFEHQRLSRRIPDKNGLFKLFISYLSVRKTIVLSNRYRKGDARKKREEKLHVDSGQAQKKGFFLRDPPFCAFFEAYLYQKFKSAPGTYTIQSTGPSFR